MMAARRYCWRIGGPVTLGGGVERPGEVFRDALRLNPSAESQHPSDC